MKRLGNIFMILILLGISGCMTKIYLGEPKIREREQSAVMFDDSQILGAINPTTIPAGGTWGTVRGIINTNFSNINGTLDSVEVTIANHGDSITAHRTDINSRLKKSDSTLYATRNWVAGELSDFNGTGNVVGAGTIAAQNIAIWTGEDTIIGDSRFTIDTTGLGSATLSGYTTNLNNTAINFGTATNGIGTIKGQSTNGPAIINRTPSATIPNIVVHKNYSTNGFGGTYGSGNNSIATIVEGQTKFQAFLTYNNSVVPLYTPASTSSLAGFRLPHGTAPTVPVNGDLWTTTGGIFTQTNGSTDTLATQAYARQYGGSGTIVMADVQNELADSLVNYVAVKDSTGIKPGRYVSGYTFQQGMINKISVSDTAAMLASYKRRLDSIADVLADSVNIETLLQVDLSKDTLATKAYARSVGGGSVSGITLNGGTLTLTGDAGTADDVTFYTNGDGQYDLPAGGGNLTIMSQVQGWISDSLDVLRTADSDTIPLFVFGAGSGSSADTALFNNGRLAGAFYNSGSDTLYVTELRGVLVEGTGTETIAVQVSWDVNMKDATPTNLNTAALTVTSMTSGTTDTSFDNNGIPPGVWVWCSLSGASANNKPTMLTLTMTGYRRNRAY